MTSQPLRVAVPWSLSHYIPLNGFHPLYRALFDHAPPGIELNAWDNVKLHNRFSRDIDIRDVMLRAANEEKNEINQLGTRTLARKYREHFWAPNQVLTSGLTGDIELHHTAPYPSLKRPFVLHCESFAPVFLPFAEQGSGEFRNHIELREHYRRILENPLCLGIFSHIPDTLVSLSQFFSSDVINQKLFSSKIGMSLKAIADIDAPKHVSLSRPTFLFVNSANQNPENFFRRGGHIVLRFWKEFIANGRDGLLILRCARPNDEDLLEYGVDTSFLSAETGRSILWAEGYLANHEMNALMASVHFFLLPSLSLHSVSIMQAMLLGAIPVVTDTVGTSVYLEDDMDGIMLRGVRDAIWRQDPNTGILVDRYRRTQVLDSSMVSQMTSRILSVLDTRGAYQKMRNSMITNAQRKFSGDSFGSGFWNTVHQLYDNQKQPVSAHYSRPNDFVNSLSDCTLQVHEWARLFESATQPVRKIFTGRSVVWELGGAYIHAYGNPPMSLHDWSVFARYFSPDAPETTFAILLDDLGGKYLSYAGEPGNGANRQMIGFISRALMPYPGLHSLAAENLKRIRRYRKSLTHKLRWIRRYRNFLAYQFGKSSMEPDVELVHHAVSGYNVIRYFHKYYAIPQGEGAFIPEKAKAGGYSSCFYGNTSDHVLRQIIHAASEIKQ